MEERSMGLSRDGLFKFLDFTAKKGLAKEKTVKNRRSACEAILGILDNTEAADLSKVDLEDVILRHRNKAAGKIAPLSLRAYESHVRGAVRDFLEYSKNPSAWKAVVPQRTTRATKAKALTKKPKTERVTGEAEGFEKQQGMPIQPSVHIDLQVHISPETTPEQIDQIFDSMRRHLYGSRLGE